MKSLKRRQAAARFRSARGRYSAGPGLRLPAHRASSATLAGAYPFLTPPAQDIGSFVGVDALTGEGFHFDPWDLYGAGLLTNPNVVLAGAIGQGKSALAKALAIAAIEDGRRVYVPGDPKGEWAVVARAVDGIVIRLGPGEGTRLNPLQIDGDPAAAHGAHLRTLIAIAESTLGRPLRPAEHTSLEAALRQAADRRRADLTIPDIAQALAEPHAGAAKDDGTTASERAADGRDVAHALRRITRGDLAGMFDGPSTEALDLEAPMVVLDLSPLGSDDEALALAMACASGWLDSAVSGVSGGRRWIVYDEAWRLLRSAPLVRRMQAQWKLARAYGIANLLILHRLSDLDAVGAAGSESRALAEGLLADCSTRIVYRQETDQLATTARALGLSATERDVLPQLPRGTGLWSMPGRSYLVRHELDPRQAALVDTDSAMRGDPRRHL